MLLRFSITFILLTPISLFAQQKDSVNVFNCDSLSYLYMADLIVSKLPTILESPAKVQNDYLKIVDTSDLKSTIYAQVIVDPRGKAHCPRLVKGINSSIDSLALNYVLGLKYSAAEQKGKKILCPLTIPLLGENVRETRTLIKREGKWYEKTTQ